MDRGRELKQRVPQQFGAAAEAYGRSRSHSSRHDLSQLLDWARVRPSERALDVATGAGHTGLALAERGARVILLDLTLPMLHVARRAAARRGLVPLGFLVVDAETLPLIDHSVSLVTYRIAPHHFADVTAFVGEVARVLVPGGHVLLIDSLSPADRELDEQVNELERRRDPSHVRGGNGEAASRASLRGVGTRWTACGCGTERGRGSGTLAVHGVSLQRSVARAAGV